MMEVKLENTLKNNRKSLDNLYRDEVLKLPEKIDHVVTLASVDKLGLKPFHVSLIIFSQNFFFAGLTSSGWVIHYVSPC